MLADEQTNLKVKIIGITYRNSETGYSVLKAKIDKSQEIVCVTATTPDLQPNTLYEAKGHWIEHKQYGRQFQASLLIAQTPQDRFAILAYLSSGNIAGIGEKTAKAIVQKFGDRTLEILDKHPEQLLNVEKIGRKKLKLIRESWREQTSQRDLVIFLQSHAVPLRFMTKLIQTYGAHTKEKIENEPYDLINDIPGIGFILADRIAQKNGLQADAVARIEAAAYYLINEYNSRGHCFISTSQLLIALTKLLNLDEVTIGERLATALKSLNHELKIVSESLPSLRDGESALVHWKKEIYFAEQSLSQSLISLLRNAVPQINRDEFNNKIFTMNASENQQVELSEDQLQAIYLALNSKIFILTGGPGVGKTTTANLIIKYFTNLQKKICVCAPTGRAAQRLSELTALNATTIHRLLQWSPESGTFIKNETNRLEFDVVIIDETSMMDVVLASALFQAISDTTQVILIGDIYQLPAVGPGNVLRDLIQSKKITTFELNKIFRQAASSKIILTAHKINHGENPEFAQDSTSDCIFIETKDAVDFNSRLFELVTKTLPEKFNIDPKSDIQLLSPMKKGDFGTLALNFDLQTWLNPNNNKNGLSRNGYKFFAGDKVIQCSNNYELNVFNGDIGYILNIDQKSNEATILFGEREITFNSEQLSDLQLAYAITIHKSQGSEFPIVIIPISLSHYVMLQRNLIYTALTRARRFAIFIGQKKALNMAVGNNRSQKRQTRLSERLQLEALPQQLEKLRTGSLASEEQL